MEYHILSSKNVLPAFEKWKKQQEKEIEIIYLNDQLDIGLLSDTELSFSELRNNFWKHLADKKLSVYNDFDDLKIILNLLESYKNNSEIQVYYWLQSKGYYWAHYYWLLHWLHPMQEQLYIINGIGLPFLNEHKELIFPESWDEIPSNEIEKARQLARSISPSTWEIEGDIFKNMLKKQHFVRAINQQDKVEFLTTLEAKKHFLNFANNGNYGSLSTAKKKQFLREYPKSINPLLLEYWWDEAINESKEQDV